MHTQEFLTGIENIGLTPIQLVKIKNLFSKIDLFLVKGKKVELMEVYFDCYKKTGITLTQMRSKTRKMDVVSARLLFVRKVLSKNAAFNMNQLADFLKKDRSTIYFYAYKSKEKCEMQPLKIYIRNYRMLIDNPKRKKHVAIHRLQKTKAA